MYRDARLSDAYLAVSCGITWHLVAQLWRECLSQSQSITAAEAISTYIEAKDRNRPQLMKRAFVQECELQMRAPDRSDLVSKLRSWIGERDRCSRAELWIAV